MLKESRYICLSLMCCVCAVFISKTVHAQSIQLDTAQVFYQQENVKFHAEEVILSDSLWNQAQTDLTAAIEQSTVVWANSFGLNGASSPVFRGTSPSHTQVYWNGVNINSATLGQVDLRGIRLNAGQLIQINPGLSSIKDGGGGLGGSIHLNDYISRKNQTAITEAVGSFGRRVFSVSNQISDEKWVFKTSLSIENAENDFSFTNYTRRADIDNQEEDVLIATNEEGFVIENREDEHLSAQLFSATASRQIGNKNTVSVHLLASNLERGIADGIATSEPSGELIDEAFRMLVNWKRYGTWKHEAQLYRGNDTQWYTQAQVASEFVIDNASLNYKTSRALGESIVLYVSTENTFYDVESSGFQDDVQVSRHSIKGAIEGKYNHLFYSVISRMEAFRGKWSEPILAVQIGYARKHFTLSVGAGRTFRFPELNALYWASGGNPNLLPEEGVTAELTAEYKTDRFRFYSSAYHSRNQNLIQWVPSDGIGWSPQNFQDSRLFGVDAVLSYQLVKKNNHSASVTLKNSFNQSEILRDEEWVTNIYRPLLNSRAMLEYGWKKLSIQLTQDRMDKRFTSFSDEEGLPAFGLSGARAGYEFSLGKKWAISAGAGISNVLNTIYELRPWYPMPGRNYNFYINLINRENK